MDIIVGGDVEVRTDADGYLGAYYRAEVISRVGKDKLKVKYKDLLVDENRKDRLEEVVEARAVRPVPPQILVSSFNVLDCVDACFNEGWWLGRVTEWKGGSKYAVYFESTGDEYDYHVSELRIHQQYDEYNRQWVHARSKSIARLNSSPS